MRVFTNKGKHTLKYGMTSQYIYITNQEQDLYIKSTTV